MSQQIEPNKLFKQVRALLIGLLFLVYPFLVYQGITEGFVWLAPVVFSLLLVWQGRQVRDKSIAIKKYGYALLLIACSIVLPSLTAKLIPIATHITLALFFGRTLLVGPPLIERFVRLQFSDFPPGVVEYCRNLTVLWTVFFIFNTLACIALALWAPAIWWTLYNGVVITVVTILLLIGEYIWRHYRFPDLDIPSARSSAEAMIKHGREIWLDVQGNSQSVKSVD